MDPFHAFFKQWTESLTLLVPGCAANQPIANNFDSSQPVRTSVADLRWNLLQKQTWTNIYTERNYKRNKVNSNVKY